MKIKSANGSATEYSKPVIFDGGGDIKKHWYIEYYFTDYAISAQHHRFRVKQTINRYSTKKERSKQARLVRDAMEDLLLAGYNPLRPAMSYVEDAAPRVELIPMMFDMVKKMAIRPRTMWSYNQDIRLYHEWLRASNLLPNAMLLRKKDAYNFRDWLSTRYSNNKSINNVIGGLSSVYTQLIKREELSVNPFAGMEELPVAQQVKLDWTDEERNKLKDIFPPTHGMYIISNLIYYAGLRPNEITQLKVGDIIYQKQTILIQGTATKNKKANYIPLHPELYELLLPYTKKASDTDYIISLGMKPGAKRINRNLISKRFKKEFKDVTGITKDLYHLKKTAINNLFQSGVNSKSVQHHFRHHSLEMTDIYARNFTNSQDSELMKRFVKF